MIIYTNEGNPLGLKLLICAKLAKKPATVKFVTLNGPIVPELKHLPTLELDSGIQIFSTDSAVRYLCPPADNNTTDSWRYWLEWSTTRLAPALAQGLEPKSNAGAREALNCCLKSLNDTLTKSIYVAGAKLTSADVSIWSLLAAAGKLLSQTPDFESLLIWSKTISQNSAVSESLATFPLEKLSFASLQLANKFGGLGHIVLPNTISDEDKVQLSDSPGGTSETISGEELGVAKASFVYSTPETIHRTCPVLPLVGKRNILITSALPYVNNVPHLGNIIGCVLSADIFARYCRTAGYNTLYIGGTDEYGTATENKALAEKVTPQQICDKYFVVHHDIYKWFSISFDHFGRTTTAEQTKIVQQMFHDCLKNDMLFTQTVDQLLCQKCDRYLADRFVEGTCPHPGCGYEDARGDQCDGCSKLVNAIELINPRCNVCRTAPVVRQSSQFFLNLPKIEPKLVAWLETCDSKWSHNARVITKSWIREGLKPRCITRDLKWGIPVPHKGFESKVFYVWFDAPIGYMSITNTYTDKWEQWWRPAANVNVELFQFMAKDNVPFHSVMFPSTLLAVDKGYTLVSSIMATEYLNYEDGKFSKSRGTGVFGNDAKDTGIPSDVWRFYLASGRPEGQDSNFNWTELITRNNSELLNNLGNFINRSLVFCEKNFNATIPAINVTEVELNLLALINRELADYVCAMERAKYRDGLKYTLTVSRLGNQYMQAQQPWVMLKGTDDDKGRAATVIGLCCNIVCLLAGMLSAFMPDTVVTIYGQLATIPRQLDPEKPVMRQFFETGHKIGKPVPLFAKIEPAKAEEFKKTYGGSQTVQSSAKREVKAEKIVFKTAAEAEAAVAAQAELVRVAKASGVEKTVWQADVVILLDYKKQLAELQKTVSVPTAVNKIEVTAAVVSAAPATADDLEARIAKQAEKVRQLKSSSSDKAVWTPEVNVLALKKELAALTGQVAAAPASALSGKSGKNKKKK